VVYCILYVCLFITVAIKTAKTYRKNFIETNHQTEILYSHKIFCVWEYSISHLKAAKLKHNMIVNECRELLQSDQFTEIEESRRGKLLPVWNLSKKIFLHFIIIISILSLGWIFYKMLEKYEEDQGHHKWNLLIVPVTIELSILFSSLVFSQISRLDKFQMQSQLNIMNIYNFIFVIYASCCLLTFWIIKKEKGGNDCYETIIATHIYTFLIVDFIINILLVNFYYVGRFLLSK
jgi:hypothetical protein